MSKERGWPAESMHRPLCSQVRVTCLLNLSLLQKLDPPPGGVVRQKELAIDMDSRPLGARLTLLGTYVRFRTLQAPRLPLWESGYGTPPELAPSGLDSARYKEGGCQVQWKQKSCWFFGVASEVNSL